MFGCRQCNYDLCIKCFQTQRQPDIGWEQRQDRNKERRHEITSPSNRIEGTSNDQTSKEEGAVYENDDPSDTTKERLASLKALVDEENEEDPSSKHQPPKRGAFSKIAKVIESQGNCSRSLCSFFFGQKLPVIIE
eukprot:CAMPEP_0185763026 /NCGR_PEP_ID=MMETSP1174-20130828/21978_1 /TAXON_ID=35687 /ORGANISM="Dictyocha speculum, Strain CCMP1381" /LENGTH=134 /DNA_ID=CAMNT_0028444949 /DNA_START=1 /DNA_END=405 /DNA_ORIENTATION=+